MQNKKTPYIRRLGKDLKRYSGAYVMAIPVVAFYLLFCYKPMYGIIIAFKDYSPAAGIWGSDWASNHGLQNFIDFFQSYYFGRILKNTLVISLTSILFGFPAPIILALLLNELRNEKFKRITQTISYMPHFISLVVICSMIKMFTSDKGLVTYLLSFLGGPEISLLTKPQYFVPIYVISGIWQELGWGAIIYLAALSGIDQELYEAAYVDGIKNRAQEIIYITIPSMKPQMLFGAVMSIVNAFNMGWIGVALAGANPTPEYSGQLIANHIDDYAFVRYEMGYAAAVSVALLCLVWVCSQIANKLFTEKDEY